MGQSFALKGAVRYLREEYKDEGLDEVVDICEKLTNDLAKKRGFLHPRALAATSSHIHKTRLGIPVTLQKTSARFKVSTATLREYLRIYPTLSDHTETIRAVVTKHVRRDEVEDVMNICDSLHTEISRRKASLNIHALAAASTYIYYYKAGKQVSLIELAHTFGISTSTLRDYISFKGEELNELDRAKTLILQHVSGEALDRIVEIMKDVNVSTNISTPRILAALGLYLHQIETEKYTTIENVARQFNVSIPALRSYLKPYFPKIANSMLLFKKGTATDIKSLLDKLNESEKELINLIFNNYNLNIFEMNDLFKLDHRIPRGRWQVFLREMTKMGLVDIYKKPLDPKQYFSLISELQYHLGSSERLERWVDVR